MGGGGGGGGGGVAMLINWVGVKKNRGSDLLER